MSKDEYMKIYFKYKYRANTKKKLVDKLQLQKFKKQKEIFD
jgi:hypothetical protein